MSNVKYVADALFSGSIKKKRNGKYYYSVPTNIRRSGEMLVTEKQIKSACKKYGIEIIQFNGFTFEIKK